MAIIDRYSRKVLGWRISNLLDAGFCVDCLEAVIKLHGKLEIFNTERPHQSLEYETPDRAYASANGGGASIPDRFGGAMLVAGALPAHQGHSH